MSGHSVAFNPTEEGSIDMDSQLARIHTELTDAECLIHLNLTPRAFLPLIHDAIDKGRDSHGHLLRLEVGVDARTDLEVLDDWGVIDLRSNAGTARHPGSRAP